MKKCQHSMQNQDFPAVFRVLLTGGGHGGKTSIAQYLKQKLEHECTDTIVILVPESATTVVNMCGKENAPLVHGDGIIFQRVVAEMQVAQETAAETMALSLLNTSQLQQGQIKRVILIFDRGIMDG